MSTSKSKSEFSIVRKQVSIGDTVYFVYIRQIDSHLTFGGCMKKYESRKCYNGYSWTFVKHTYDCYMQHEQFMDDWNTGCTTSEVLAYEALSVSDFYAILEEFVYWFNQAEDGSFGVLEVLDLVKALFVNSQSQNE